MRVLSGLFVVLLATIPPNQDAGAGGPRKFYRAAIDADLSYWENAWGFKKKSVSVELTENADLARVVYVIEFGKDVRNYDLDALQKLFFVPGVQVRHVFFDEDNIAINAVVPTGYLIQGDISGVTGDALRVTIEFRVDPRIFDRDPRGLQNAKKLAIRPINS